MQYKHAVLIQWSEEDQKFIATLPEWGGAHTHGSTYAEAAAMAEEAMEALLEGEEQPPVPALFPGDTFSPLLRAHAFIPPPGMEIPGEDDPVWDADEDDPFLRPPTFRQRWRGRLYRAQMWPVERWRDLRAFWQRGRRGWADRDAWNADTYYAKVLGESLAYLAEQRHGYPVQFGSLTTWQTYLRRLALAFLDYAQATENMDMDWGQYRRLVAQMRCVFDHWRDLWD